MAKRKRAAPAPPAPAASGLTGRRLAALAAASGALAAIVHGASLKVPFVFDDAFTVVQNPTLRAPVNVVALLLWSRFRPLVNVSYAIDAAVHGIEPFGFHLTNLLLHGLCAALAALVATAAARDAAVRAGVRSPALGWQLLPAALFAVHPMLTQGVAYVSARSELLSTAFGLVALLALRRAYFSPKATWLVLGASSLVAALASKESAAAVPFVALGWAFWLLPAPASPHQVRARRTVWALVGLVAVAGVLRVLALWRFEAPVPRGPFEHLMLEGVLLWTYLRLFLLPYGQTLEHGVREIASPFELWVVLAFAALAAGAFLVVRVRRAAPLAVLGIGWFLLFLLPSSSVVPLNEPMSEHRAYGASLGLFLAVSHGLWRAARALGSERAERATGLAAVAGAVAVFAPLTYLRDTVWADPVRLWTEAVEASPGVWAAQYSLGGLLANQDNCRDAVKPLRAAIALVPDEVKAHNTLAHCLATLGHLDQAYAVLTEATRRAPNDAQTWANLAALAVASRRPDKAREFLTRALVLEPGATTRRDHLKDLDGMPLDERAPWPPLP